VNRPKDFSKLKYIITDVDIIGILIALSNDDIEYVIDFFENLEPIKEEKITYTLEQLLANTNIVKSNQ